MPGYLLGLDIGTTGTKGVVYDLNGAAIADALVEYPLSQPHPGWSEQDPELWWSATKDVLAKILGSGKVQAADIQGIGLSGQMHGSVFLDSGGKVIRPCILWNDSRTDEECRRIIDTLGPDRLSELTCNTAQTGFTAPKVLWLQKHEPENYERVRWICLPKDYVRYRLTGEILCEVSDAAGTLMFDVRRRQWSQAFCEAFGIDAAHLPECRESVDICGQVTAAASAETGLAAGTPCVGGGADNTCGATGTGIIRNGRVLASVGTSGVIFAHTDTVRMDPEQRIHSFCHSVPGASYLMGVVLSAGLSLRWFRDELGAAETAEARKRGVDPYEVITAEAAEVEPGAGGLIYLPYLMGERSPHKDPFARSVFFGITGRHTRKDMARAVLEGVSFGLRDSLEIMRELGQPIDEIRVTGGGGKSAFWRQLMADVFDAPVSTINNSEGPSFGAAIMAGVGTGAYPSIPEAVDQLVTVVSTTDPRPAGVARYNDVFPLYQRLYRSLKDDFREAARLAGRSPE